MEGGFALMMIWRVEFFALMRESLGLGVGDWVYFIL